MFVWKLSDTQMTVNFLECFVYLASNRRLHFCLAACTLYRIYQGGFQTSSQGGAIRQAKQVDLFWLKMYEAKSVFFLIE